MPYTPHPDCILPEEGILWKYLDLAKFLSLITTSSLYFNRLDKFDDPWEGRFLLTKDSPFAKVNGIAAARSVNKGFDGLRKQFYVSSWHMNEGESASMWKLYGRDEYGLAIKSSIKKIQDAVHHIAAPIYIGQVRYSEIEDTSAYFQYVYYKRNTFDCEKEVRLMIWNQKNSPDFIESENPFGLSPKINLADLIDAIYINPTSEAWLKPVIEDVCSKFGIRAPIIRSDLYTLISDI